MNNKFLVLLFSVSSLLSCSSREYLEFRHKNVSIFNDEVIIRLTSKKNKDFVIVKSTYYTTVTKSNPYRLISHEKIYDRKKISKEKYIEIVNMFNLVNENDLKYPKTGKTEDGREYIHVILDGGSNSLYLKNDTIKRKWHSYGISKDLYGNFYNTIELIMRTVELDMDYID